MGWDKKTRDYVYDLKKQGQKNDYIFKKTGVHPRTLRRWFGTFFDPLKVYEGRINFLAKKSSKTECDFREMKRLAIDLIKINHVKQRLN